MVKRKCDFIPMLINYLSYGINISIYQDATNCLTYILFGLNEKTASDWLRQMVISYCG